MEDLKTLKNRIAYLEKELTIMKRSLGADREKKNPKAWDKLHEIGKQISSTWKTKKPSWQLISEARR